MDMMVPILNFSGKGGRKRLTVKTNKTKVKGSAPVHQKKAKTTQKARKNVQYKQRIMYGYGRCFCLQHPSLLKLIADAGDDAGCQSTQCSWHSEKAEAQR